MWITLDQWGGAFLGFFEEEIQPWLTCKLDEDKLLIAPT
jgi:hypothetical protein